MSHGQAMMLLIELGPVGVAALIWCVKQFLR